GPGADRALAGDVGRVGGDLLELVHERSVRTVRDGGRRDEGDLRELRDLREDHDVGPQVGERHVLHGLEQAVLVIEKQHHRVGGIEEHCLVHVVFLWNGKRFTALSYGRFGSSVASLPLPGINSVASAEPSYPCGAPPDGMTYSGDLRRGGAEGLRVGVLDV